MKKNLLEAKMKIHGDRQEDLAKAIGISLNTFSMKLNGRNDRGFTVGEIQKIKERYSLTSEEAVEIFFD